MPWPCGTDIVRRELRGNTHSVVTTAAERMPHEDDRPLDRRAGRRRRRRADRRRCYDPARGVADRPRWRWRRPPRSTTWSRWRSRRAASWGDSSLSRRGPGAVPVPRADRRPPRRAGRASSPREHGKVLADALGEVARGLECVEFACGIPHLLKGSHSSEVSTGVDVLTVLQPVGVVAGITPFNFPVDGPAVDDGQRHRVRQRLRAQAVGEGPVGVAAAGRAGARGRLPRRRVQRGAGRRRGGRRAARRIPTSTRCRSSGSTPVARHIYETGTTARQAGAGARRRQEPHGRAARRRPRRRRRRRRQRRLRLGGRAVHGDLGGRGGRATSPTTLVDAIAARIPDVVVGPGDDPALDDGPAHHRRAP